jgi:hypothetical protein
MIATCESKIKVRLYDCIGYLSTVMPIDIASINLKTAVEA